MPTVDPTPDQIRALAAEARTATGPVVMVNLLRFAGEEGRASYRAYAEQALPLLHRAGASVVYAGEAAAAVIGPDPWWHEVLLVRYPSRQAFLDAVMDPEYQAFTHLRTAALEDARLVPTDPAPGL